MIEAGFKEQTLRDEVMPRKTKSGKKRLPVCPYWEKLYCKPSLKYRALGRFQCFMETYFESCDIWKRLDEADGDFSVLVEVA